MESVTSSPRRPSSRSRSSGDRARDAANRQAFRAGYRLRMRRRWRWVFLGALMAGLLAALTGWLTDYPRWRASGTLALELGRPSADAMSTDNAAPKTQTAATPWQRARLDEVLERELDLLKRLGGAPITAQRVPGTLTRLEITARADGATQAEALVTGTLAAYRAQTQLAPEAEASDRLNAQAQRLDRRRTDLAERRRNATAGVKGPSNADVPQPGDAELRWQAAAAATDTAQRRAEIATRHAQVLLDAAPPRLTELAAVDPETRDLLDRRNALDETLHNTVRPPSPLTAERIDERDALDARLKTRLADTRLLPSEDNANGAAQPPRPVSVSAALAQTERLEAEAAAAARRMDMLEPQVSAQRIQTAALEADAESLRADAAELSRQRAALGPGGGIVRLAPAHTPGSDAAVVDHDPRPRRAVLSGLAGLGVGGLLPLLWFVSDRRVRRTRQGELAGTETPLLGTVPVMDRIDEAEDASERGVAGGPVASIDAVRAVLEARVEGGDRAFAVTGVAGGSGATSVAVGLAVSMALAGQRVLLIDLSWLQKPSDANREGKDTETGRGVDGVIAELGYLDDEDRERLMLSQHETDTEDADARGGFTALLAGSNLSKCVLRTRLPRLSVLSALGRGDALREAWTGRLSSKWMRRLIEVCRGTGFVLVIDTGAADGGVEGVLACAAADGALVVVTSRQTQSEFARCAGRLKLVGAHVIGTVLNRHGQRRLAAGNPDRRRIAAGGTRGSGLFAAAIEAHRGDDARRAPMPHVSAPAASETGSGVDPVEEPPTAVQPTPKRRPPAPLTGDRTASEVHVVDDVMDQLVDHAIRSAQSHRRGATPPTATSSTGSPPRSDPT